MSSDIDCGFEGLLDIPDLSSINDIQSTDNNIFGQQTFSLSNEFELTGNEEITQSIEKIIETKFSKVEEHLLHMERENEDFRKLLSANINKGDHIIQLLNDRFAETSISAHGLNSLGDGFEQCPKADPVLCESSLKQTNDRCFNKREIVGEGLDGVEKKIDSIYEHIKFSNKKFGQDILDLDNNVHQRVAIIEKKLDGISVDVGSIEKKYKVETTETNEIKAMLAQIIGSIVKISKDVEQSSTVISKNKKELLNNSNEQSSIDERKTKQNNNALMKSADTLIEEPSKVQKSLEKFRKYNVSLNNSPKSKLNVGTSHSDQILHSKVKLPSADSSKRASTSKFDYRTDNNVIMINTKSLLQKTSKLQTSVDEIQDNIRSSSCKTARLRKSVDNLNEHKIQLTSKSACDKRKKCSVSFSSSSNEDDSDDNGKTTIFMTKQIDSIFSGVEEIKQKMDSWLKYSKKTIKKSDENTNTMLEKLVSMGMAFQTASSEDRILHENTSQRLNNIKAVLTGTQNCKAHEFSGFSEKIEKLTSIVEEYFTKTQSSETRDKQQMEVNNLLDKINSTFNSKLDAFQELVDSFTSGESKHIQEIIMQIKMTNVNQLSRMDEIMQNIKHIQYNLSNEGTLLPLLRGVDAKAHDLFNRIIPMLEKIQTEQGGNATRNSTEDRENKGQVQKILDLVESMEESMSETKSRATAAETSAIDNNFMMQVLKAINDMKAQSSSQDQNIVKRLNVMMIKNLNETKSENTRIASRLNEIFKTKSSEKQLQRVCMLIEESKANDVSNKKTLSTINSTLQSMKTNNNKLFGHIKDVKTICAKQSEGTSSNVLTKDIKKLQSNQDVYIQEVKKLQKEEFDELKTMFSSLTKSQQKLNELNEELLKRNPQVHIDDESLQKILDAISDHEFFTHFQPEEIIQKNIKTATSEATKIIKAIEVKCVSLEQIENQHHKFLINLLNRMLTEIRQNPSISEIHQKHKALHNGLEEALINTYIKHTKKIFEEVEKHSGFHSEILNSIEDLKLLSSSTPNTIADLFTLVEKLVEDISRIPDDIGRNNAGLEENLCANLETRVKEINELSLQNIFGHFEKIEQRMAVIKKYVKHGTTNTIIHGDCSTPNNGSSEQIEKLIVKQTECLDILKMLQCTSGVRNQKGFLNTNYKATANSVVELINCLRTLENTQKDFISERNRNADYQNATKNCLSKVTPTLENIVNVLQQSKIQRNFSAGLITELYIELNKSTIILRELNLSLPTIVPIKPNDISDLIVEVSMNLNKLVADIFSFIEKNRMANQRLRCRGVKVKGRNVFQRRMGVYNKKPLWNRFNIQFRSQSPLSNSTLGRDDLCENLMENVQSNNLSSITMPKQPTTPTANALIGSDQNLSRPRKRSRNLSSSNNVNDDNESYQTVTSVNSLSTAFTCRTDDIKRSFFPPSLDRLSQQRLKDGTNSAQLH